MLAATRLSRQATGSASETRLDVPSSGLFRVWWTLQEDRADPAARVSGSAVAQVSDHRGSGVLSRALPEARAENRDSAQLPSSHGPYPKAYKKSCTLLILNGGEGGIRNHGGVTPSTVFETARFNRSRTSPHRARRTECVFILADRPWASLSGSTSREHTPAGEEECPQESRSDGPLYGSAVNSAGEP